MSKNHVTPLHEAAHNEDLHLVKLLLDHNANVYARNSHGLTARQLVPSSISTCKVYLQEWESKYLNNFWNNFRIFVTMLFMSEHQHIER